MTSTAEGERLRDARSGGWRQWGPYLSERQWGTVREDYSDNGDAWNYFTHDQARSRAYRWGEDGLAGVSDDKQLLCFALGAVERPGPDPEGAAVRAHQLRGQPRRGREGVLLLPRHDAHPLVRCSGSTSTRRRRSLRRPRRRPTARAVATSWSTSCSTPASSTTTATSTSTSTTPRPRPRPAGPDHRPQPRPRRGARSTCCRRCGSATPGRRAPVRRGRRCAPRRRRGAGRRRQRTTSSASTGLHVRRRRRAAVQRERDERRSGSGASPTARRYVKDGIDDARRHGDADAVNPARRAPRPRPTAARRSPAGRVAVARGCG